jgi:hypothetical protein
MTAIGPNIDRVVQKVRAPRRKTEQSEADEGLGQHPGMSEYPSRARCGENEDILHPLAGTRRPNDVAQQRRPATYQSRLYQRDPLAPLC